MKRTIIILSAILSALLLSAPALAISLEAGTGEAFYVQDSANVLSAATEAQIVAYNETLENQCSDAQLVVVTVSYLNEDSDVAALQLMNDWGVGSAQDSNGMLLLLVANEYRGWLATGDGIDEVFTDRMAEEYLEDYFWDYIDRDKFDEGVQSLTAELYDWYIDYYDLSDPAAINQTGGYEYDPPPRHGGSSMNIISIIIMLVVVWALVSGSRYRRMRGWGYGGGFWPIFWFGGNRMFHSYHRSHRPPHPPQPPRGPHGPGGMGYRSASRPGPNRGGVGGSRPGGMGGGFRGGGMGGRGGGGGGGRR